VPAVQEDDEDDEGSENMRRLLEAERKKRLPPSTQTVRKTLMPHMRRPNVYMKVRNAEVFRSRLP